MVYMRADTMDEDIHWAIPEINRDLLCAFLPDFRWKSQSEPSQSSLYRQSDYVRCGQIRKSDLAEALQCVFRALQLEMDRSGAANPALADALEQAYHRDKTLPHLHSHHCHVQQHGERYPHTRARFMALSELSYTYNSRRLAAVLSQFFVRRGRCIGSKERSAMLMLWGDAIVRCPMSRDESTSCMMEIADVRPDLTFKISTTQAHAMPMGLDFLHRLEEAIDMREAISSGVGVGVGIGVGDGRREYHGQRVPDFRPGLRPPRRAMRDGYCDEAYNAYGPSASPMRDGLVHVGDDAQDEKIEELEEGLQTCFETLERHKRILRSRSRSRLPYEAAL